MTHLQAINADMMTISTDAQKLDYAATGSDCNRLSKDITAANAYGPIPDSQTETHWATALADFQTAAANCIVGTSTQDAGTMQKAVDEMSAGNDEVTKVAARLAQISG